YIMMFLVIYACKKDPVEKGFISDEIRLKGADTIDVPIGIRTNTDVAWLDGSSQPVEFYIENIRDANGNRSEQFFEELPYRSWLQPYNYLTDTIRSEEHTSELQSRENLVCRLLLEKKKNNRL